MSNQYTYLHDTVELFINSKKFNLDYKFVVTWDVESQDKRQACILTLYNYNPPLSKLQQINSSGLVAKSSPIQIKVNGLEMFAGYFFDSVDKLELVKSNTHTEFIMPLTTEPPKLINEKAKHKGIYHIEKNKQFQDYVNSNYDFTIVNEGQFPIKDNSIPNWEKIIKNNTLEPHVIVNGQVFFPSKLGINKIKKVIAVTQNLDSTLNIACLYNHNIFAGSLISYVGDYGAGIYIATKVDNSFDTKKGFTQELYCMEQNTYLKQKKKDANKGNEGENNNG